MAKGVQCSVYYQDEDSTLFKSYEPDDSIQVSSFDRFYKKFKPNLSDLHGD